MKFPRVRQFCCFDVRGGSLFIACCELAYAILGLAYQGRLAVLTLSAASENAAHDKPEPTFFVRREFGKVAFWFDIAELIAVFLMSSLLIHGIRTKQRPYYVPWLGAHFLTTAVFGIFAIVLTVGSFVEFGTRTAESGFAAAALCLLFFLANGYITTVVYSHYKQIEEDSRAQRLFSPLEVEVRVPYPVDMLPPSYDEVVKNKEAYALLSEVQK